ncbi:NF-kappa-B inhibitor alpha-like [Stegodyphus dumicola]|uniref:NF-kappa-B inhibitor alpha-like n=1 Tax=Stegodyphus dumicola TaxID=202533 RepID=UPI0015AF4AC0|nr:NF-kappa-B inhibitor alpha-like [Stegodyphus dumicola]
MKWTGVEKCESGSTAETLPEGAPYTPEPVHISPIRNSNIEIYLKKRRFDRNETLMPPTFKGTGTEGQVSVGGRADGGGQAMNPDRLREIQTAVHCSHSKIPNKSELRALCIQRAMLSDDDGDRPIHVAVAREDLKIVRKLCVLMLRNSISIDLTNFLRQTPLHLAVILGNAEMVRLLLRCGAAVTLRDRNGNSVFHLAVKANANAEVLQLLLTQPQSKTVINSMDHEGYSALHYAVFKNNQTAVKYIHQYGANMNIVDGKSGRSALIHAVLDQNAEMVSLLLECGASAETQDYSGRSAFELALQSSNAQIYKLLENRITVNELSTTSYPKSDSPKNVFEYNIAPSVNKAVKRTLNQVTVVKVKKTSDAKRSTRLEKQNFAVKGQEEMNS